MILRSTVVPAVLAASALLGACAPDVQFTDDFDFRFDLRNIGGRDKLDLPYVEGTPVRLRVTTARDERRLTVVSSDPSVFRIDAVLPGEDEIVLSCTATGPGIAELTVFKDLERVVDSTFIEVGRPDRAELHGAGSVFAMLGDAESLSPDPVVLDGGTATYEVRWFDGERQLFGNSILDVEASPSLSPRTHASFLGENREWLQIRAVAPGEGELTLFAGDRELDTHVVDVVPAETVASVELAGASEVGAREGAVITVLGIARDAGRTPIHGVDFGWMRDGLVEQGTGDMYRYTLVPELDGVPLVADFDGLRAERTIRGNGSVQSSNDLACNTRGGLSGGLLGLALVGIGTRRRQGPRPGASRADLVRPFPP